MQIVTDATLSRQLSRLKLDEEHAPSAQDWQKLLKYLNSHYKHVDEDRNLMARSLEVSTEEMSRIRESISIERDELKQTMVLFRTALDDFAEACRSTRNSGGEDTTAITGARKRFNMSIIGLLSTVNENSHEYRELLNGFRNSFINVFEEVMSMVNPESAVTDEVVKLHAKLIVPKYDEEAEGLRVAAFCDQLTSIGGDLWVVKRLPSGQELLCIGDATGHGATAGFFSGVLAASLNAWLESQHTVDLEKLFRHLNDVAIRVGDGTMFMTWCGILIEPDRQSASVINAGHVFPIVLRSGTSKAIIIQGNPLGTRGDVRVKLGRVQLQSGDKIVLFTDGITETRNDLGGEYSERRLRKFLEAHSELGPLELATHIRDDVSLFRSNSPMIDDATVVVAAIR